MKMDTAHCINKQDITINKSSIRYVICVCLLFMALIFGRTVSDTFFYVFAVISLSVFVASSVSHCFSLLLFLLPFASILKLNVDDISFFTLLFFVVILKMIIKKKSIHINVLVAIILFATYGVVFSGLGQLTTVITMVAGLIMVYCLRTVDVDTNASIIAFSMGITFSSILALLKGTFPIINTFVSNIMFKLAENSYATRFSGLQGNPNYYTIDIIIVLSAIIVMLYYKSAISVYIMCLVPLSVFGLMSVSKSFLFSFILLITIWFLLSMKQGVGKFAKFVMITIVVATVVYFFAYDYVNLYLFRFNDDSKNSLSSITTGRTDIWKQYIDALLNDYKILFLGNGLNTLIGSGRGTHNTYLESLFSLGVLGTTLFLVTIKTCMGKIIVKPIMWVPVIMLLFRMIAIGILTYDNLWFYLSLLVVLAKKIKSEETFER